jgi:hypothetical protein
MTNFVARLAHLSAPAGQATVAGGTEAPGQHQEVDRGPELTKFSAIPSMVPEKTLSGDVAPLHSVMASWKLPICHQYQVVKSSSCLFLVAPHQPSLSLVLSIQFAEQLLHAAWHPHWPVLVV